MSDRPRPRPNARRSTTAVARLRQLALALVLALVSLMSVGTVTHASVGTPRLNQGEALAAGQSLSSPSGTMNLFMQGDGNLVLYAPGMSARWQSGTSGHPGAWVQLQGDGNLVVYAPGAVPLWSSMGNAGAGPASFLQVQDDGNLVLYSSTSTPVWNTNTFWFPSAIQAQASLAPGQGLQSPNGRYTLKVASTSVDLYADGVWQWRIGSGGQQITQLVAQADGNLVLYTTSGYAWATMTNTQPGGLFQVQDDGNVVLYSASLQPLWWSVGATNLDRGAPAPSSKAQIAIAYAEQQIGKPYVWATSGEDTFDCSGLTMAAWARAGISLVHKAQKQYNNGARYPIAQRQPGDLIFYGSSAGAITHVALYIGGDRIIHAAGVNSGVKYSQYNYSSKVLPMVVRPTG
ncbi:NlpC/P60 family protein [Cellulomonas sp. URHB0016]